MVEPATMLSSAVTSNVTSDVTDYAAGQLIGEKYRLVRFLAEGSQGSVWLAENLALCAQVAVKIVHADPSNPAATLRLEKEARAAARIGHPGVVRVFDLGQTESGDAFIVMEFLQGNTLGERLTTSRRLSPIEAVRTLLPIADVLHVAHDAGIVHRDLKPENVFLATTGSTVQPKLLDFGIAKRRRVTNSNEPVITDVGTLVGSPAYLSPEQASCREDVGRGADVWGFCVVLYECLTGALPFSTENYRDLFRRIREEAPQPLHVHGVTDVELWQIVRRGLAKDPSERWPDMQSLGRALAGWLKTRGVQDDISGMRLDSRWLARSRSDRAATPESGEPHSFVRRIGTDDDVPVSGRAPRRRSASRWLVLGGVVALATSLLLGYGLMTPPAARGADLATAVEVPVIVSSSPAAPILTAIASVAVPPANGAKAPTPAPSPPVTTTPHASQAATNPPPKAAPRKPSGSGTAAARAQRFRQPTDSDLLEPY